MTSTDQTGSTTLDYDWDMIYNGLQTTVVNMAGTGDWDIDYTGSEGSYSFNMGWATGNGGISIPLMGCPDGMMTWYLDSYEVVLDFNDPEGMVTWTLKENGSTVSSGTESMDCY